MIHTPLERTETFSQRSLKKTYAVKEQDMNFVPNNLY